MSSGYDKAVAFITHVRGGACTRSTQDQANQHYHMDIGEAHMIPPLAKELLSVDDW